jgi:hypothetical protein
LTHALQKAFLVEVSVGKMLRMRLREREVTPFRAVATPVDPSAL